MTRRRRPREKEPDLCRGCTFLLLSIYCPVHGAEMRAILEEASRRGRSATEAKAA